LDILLLLVSSTPALLASLVLLLACQRTLAAVHVISMAIIAQVSTTFRVLSFRECNNNLFAISREYISLYVRLWWRRLLLPRPNCGSNSRQRGLLHRRLQGQSVPARNVEELDAVCRCQYWSRSSDGDGELCSRLSAVPKQYVQICQVNTVHGG
jgi:hypothetical protein